MLELTSWKQCIYYSNWVRSNTSWRFMVSAGALTSETVLFGCDVRGHFDPIWMVMHIDQLESIYSDSELDCPTLELQTSVHVIYITYMYMQFCNGWDRSIWSCRAPANWHLNFIIPSFTILHWRNRIWHVFTRLNIHDTWWRELHVQTTLSYENTSFSPTT